MNHKIQLWRILCNKKEEALTVSMKTMGPIDLQDNLELTADETLALQRWSVPSQLVELKITYKKK